MVKRTLQLFVFTFIGMAVVCYAAPPAPTSLHALWQIWSGYCGTLTLQNGQYEFAHRGEETCVSVVGSDFVTFVQRSANPHKQYLIVPMERVTLKYLK